MWAWGRGKGLPPGRRPPALGWGKEGMSQGGEGRSWEGEGSPGPAEPDDTHTPQSSSSLLKGAWASESTRWARLAFKHSSYKWAGHCLLALQAASEARGRSVPHVAGAGRRAGKGAREAEDPLPPGYLPLLPRGCEHEHTRITWGGYPPTKPESAW